MDELIARLRSLPKEPQGCQGGVFPWPHLVRDESGDSFRPVFPLWADLESGAIHSHTLLAPGDDGLRTSLEALGGFVEKIFDNEACPQWLEVCDPELAEYLRRHLEGTGIEVHLTEQLAILESALQAMANMFNMQVEAQPSLLNAQGVTLEHVRSFADAAAACYRSAPWRRLSDVDLIKVEAPRPPSGLTYLVVMGAGRTIYGLSFYPSRAAYYGFMRAGQEGTYQPDISAGLAQITFEPLHDLLVADAMLWNEHQLAVAGEQAYPMAVKHHEEGKISRPSKRELAYFDGVLRAIATTSEDEIDSGRWQKRVTTSGGSKAFTLSIPDLLEPPSPQEWLRRGFAPDRRAAERMLADIDRHVAQNPLTNSKELESLTRLYADRSLDDPLTQPSSPAERARDLCFDAFDTHGRRRVQLARQALQLDGDCADAYVLLAEQAGDLEDQIDYYRRGTEAAERRLGSEFFAENAGRFFGISATRPYMRARIGWATSLEAAGQTDQAREHYQELLRLNPDDNLGVRYLLMPLLLATGRDVEAARLLKDSDEVSAHWAYTRALLAFRLSGPSVAANRELRDAIDVNPHFPDLLCSQEPLPQPAHYVPGSFEEACVAVEELLPAFEASPGAMEWIAESQ